MRTRLKYILSTVCLACAFTACNDNDDTAVIEEPISTETKVEDGVVQFAITQSSPIGYAYNGDLESATAGETTITGDVLVYVFDADGLFEKREQLSVTGSSGTYLTDPFTVVSGDKYFYVFANMASALGAAPTTKIYKGDFETQTLNTLASQMTLNNNFYIGTLESKVTPVTGSGTIDNPDKISLSVGRLAAKVVVNEKQPTLSGQLNGKGSFDYQNATFRILNEPYKYYWVGQSNLGIINNPGGSKIRSPHYTSYTLSTDFRANGNSFSPVGDPTYTVENTNDVPRNETATSVEYKIQYIPDGSVTFDLNGNANASLTGGTFWAGKLTNSTDIYIFNDDPSGMNITGIGQIEANAVKYDGGYNYYIIPIADTRETDPAAKYAVIRNHSYRITVNSIARLGGNEPGDIVDPPEPIDKLVGIEIEIKVLDWFLIEQGVDL